MVCTPYVMDVQVCEQFFECGYLPSMMGEACNIICLL